MSFLPKVHPSLNQARINVGQRPHLWGATLYPVDRGLLESRDRRVVVMLCEDDPIPYLVSCVVVDGKVTQDYSIVYNGKKNKSRFART